jgi:hypothetical protein
MHRFFNVHIYPQKNNELSDNALQLLYKQRDSILNNDDMKRKFTTAIDLATNPKDNDNEMDLQFINTYLVTILCIRNCQRGGVMRNMTLKEFNLAEKTLP